MIVEVLQEDIDKGRQGIHTDCVMARALSRALGKPMCVGVQYYWEDRTSVCYLMPKAARNYAIRFGIGSKVSPAKFEFEDNPTPR